MEATHLLKQQHDEVKKLFSRFHQATADGEREHLFAQIADHLAAHCAIEEKVFYPSVFVSELEDKVREATEEHLAAKRVISDLLDMSPSDDQYHAKVKVLQEEIEHHVGEEEGDLFPKVRQAFSRDELMLLGEEMEGMFRRLMLGAPRKEVPNETEQAAPLY